MEFYLKFRAKQKKFEKKGNAEMSEILAMADELIVKEA